MIFLEDITETILNEEGQFLLGMDFIQNSLGLTYKKIEKVFIKCASEYSKRRPKEITKDLTGNPIILPPNTLGVKSVRYGVLEEFPRFFQEPFDNISFEYNHNSKTVKVFPPGTKMKVTYLTGLTVTNTVKVVENIDTFEGQDEVEDTLKSSFVKGTLVIKSSYGEMSELSRSTTTVTDDFGYEIPETIVTLGGTLGTGTINLNTREYILNLLDTTGLPLTIEYYPKYKCIQELDIGDFVFYKLFAYHLLKALSVVRAQATQEDLHNIDLTNDNLTERVAILGAEVRKLMKNTISFGSLADL